MSGCRQCLTKFTTERRIRARNVCHIYLDYAFTYSFVSAIPLLLLALPFFQSHNNQNGDDNDMEASEQQRHAQGMTAPLIATAMLGGALLSCGNLSFQWATSVYKAPLTTILALQASMTVILGTSLNYVLEPHKTPHPVLLVSGVLVFLTAIGLATMAQLVYAQEQQRPSSTNNNHRPPDRMASPNGVVEYTTIELQYGTNHYLKRKESDAFTVVDDDNGPTAHRHNAMTGLWIAILGGLCFGFFSPCFNVAVNDPFGWSNKNNNASKQSTANNTNGDDPSVLVFYSNLWFSLSFGVASVVGNLILLKYYDEASVHKSIAEILETYLTQASWTDRRVALLAGLVCATGNVLQFHGGQLVGYATADLVQAYPLVSTVWDILWFGEFVNVIWCCSRLSALLFAMYLAYLGGIVLLAISSVE
eukprot:scaffold7007_cov146-Amphora_coffeaeformis.AAC.6